MESRKRTRRMRCRKKIDVDRNKKRTNGERRLKWA